MRLIDVEALACAFKEKCAEECACCNEAATVIHKGTYDSYPVFDHCGLLDKAPEVDAIPVEWICELIRQEENRKNYKAAQYLQDMIWEWHQEGEDDG